MMHAPFLALSSRGERQIFYRGNRRFAPVQDVTSQHSGLQNSPRQLNELISDEAFFHLHKIDHAIFCAVVEYFLSIGAEWCNLPLTTRMISSPGEVYAGKQLDYTTDALPIELSWFDHQRKIFLAESSQFYLELRLMIRDVDRVFSIYNSFRKEHSDFSHLSEFQHIEFEGHVTFEENISIFCELLKNITEQLIKKNKNNLEYFLTSDEVSELKHAFDVTKIRKVSFQQALQILYESTGDPRYQDFSLKHFGAWEEIKLTELLDANVLVTEFPLFQVPFYHNALASNPAGQVAENADFILTGYREVVGSGMRIVNPDQLAEKAKFFHLPLEDYEPYLRSRTLQTYRQSAGFGVGWQRYMQWLLKIPYIWQTVHIPRTHLLPML